MYDNGINMIMQTYDEMKVQRKFKHLKTVVQMYTMKLLNTNYEDVIIGLRPWLDKWRPLLGEANPTTLQMQGLIGEAMLRLGQNK